MKSIFLLIIFFTGFTSFSQLKATNSGGQVTTVQPKIMVIPYIKENEDLRTVLEADVNKRIILTEIKSAFDARKFTTVDFLAKLKAAKDNQLFTSSNQSDFKSQMIQFSGADIYVEAEMLMSNFNNNEKQLRIILTAYEASTGNSLSNIILEGRRTITDDIAMLAMRTVNPAQDNAAITIETFLNTMQGKFNEVVLNGKSIVIQIGVAQGSKYNLSSDVGTNGYTLADEIELWMEGAAYKGNYHIQGATELLMLFDDVRIPLRDQNTNANYNPNRFAMELVKHIKSLGVETVSKETKGNTIYITLK